MAETKDEEKLAKLTPAQRAAASRKKQTPEAQAEAEQGPLDYVVENAGTILIVTALICVIILALTYRQEQQLERDEKAWFTYHELEELPANAGDEDFESALAKHKGSDAAPFIKLLWADHLYSKGYRPDLEQAAELYRELSKDRALTDEIRQLVDQKLPQVEAELKSDKARLSIEEKGADETPEGVTINQPDTAVEVGEEERNE